MRPASMTPTAPCAVPSSHARREKLYACIASVTIREERFTRSALACDRSRRPDGPTGGTASRRSWSVPIAQYRRARRWEPRSSGRLRCKKTIAPLAISQSCQKSRVTRRCSINSIAIKQSDHNSIADPSGWPLTRSSNRPSGAAAQGRSAKRASRRQLSSRISPSGGISGRLATTGTMAVSVDAANTLTQGSARARPGGSGAWKGR